MGNEINVNIDQVCKNLSKTKSIPNGEGGKIRLMLGKVKNAGKALEAMLTCFDCDDYGHGNGFLSGKELKKLKNIVGGDITYDEMVGILIRQLKNRSHSQFKRKEVLEALASLPETKQIRQAIIGAIKDPGTLVACAAVAIAGERKMRDAVPVLFEQLKSETDNYTDLALIDALGEIIPGKKQRTKIENEAFKYLKFLASRKLKPEEREPQSDTCPSLYIDAAKKAVEKIEKRK